MRSLKAVWFPLFAVFCFVSGLAAHNVASQGSDPDATTPATVTQLPAATAPAAPSSFDQVLDRVLQRQRLLLAEMKPGRPLVATHHHNMKGDKELGSVP